MSKRRMFGRALVLLVLIAGFTAGGWAQADSEVDLHLHDRDCCRVIPPRRVLTQVLQLDDGQLAQVAELAREIAAAVGPLREELRMLSADLHAELNAEEPNPCVVGELVLAIRALRVEICRTVRSFADDFVEILTPEQAARWLEIREHFCRRPDRSGDASGSDG